MGAGRRIALFVAVIAQAAACCGCMTVAAAPTAGASDRAILALPPATRVLGTAAIFVSDTGQRLEVVQDPVAGLALLKLPDGETVALAEEVAGSADRFRNERMFLWHLDGVALLWIGEKLVFRGTMIR